MGRIKWNPVDRYNHAAETPIGELRIGYLPKHSRYGIRHRGVLVNNELHKDLPTAQKAAELYLTKRLSAS